MKHRKILMVVCDGVSDRPVKEHDGKTPLQVARKPAMDAVARNGVSGTMDVIAPGVVPGSDTAHLALFGYDPYRVYTGRGPIEAAGAGIALHKGDVAFRCNFAHVNDSMKVLDRRAGRIRSGTAALAQALTGMMLGDVEVIFKEGSEHRAVLVLRGPGLDHRVSEVDPHSESAVLEARALSSEAEKTARVLNEFVRRSNEVLSAHQVNTERAAEGLPSANIVLPRGAGSVSELTTLSERDGIRCAGVAGVTLVKGLCRLVGMETPDVRGATGGLDTDYGAKAEAALRLLDRNDLVFVNVKAPDIAGHDGDFRLKVQVIENIDAMLGTMLKDVHEEVLVVLTADHSTPVSVRDHSADPVPVSISGSDSRVDEVRLYDEMSAASGALGRMRGMDLMPIVLGMANRSSKFGA
ncbi:MAG: 2,3-bisphosphoglycerate-independent phosphoglycerate mutase [Methanobacteriota archaeon]|nr:MAG: 2,3-bisphosphoglycerate-independent phosphoglycerate mutase [Euryarchaeota archaeon]